MEVNFQHLQSAHCENGVTQSLLRNSGVHQITEPLAFGIGAGIFYVYVPFIKINNGPAIAFRTMPGHIFKRTCHALGIEVVRKKFNSKEEAQKVLDQALDAGNPVGCQVGVYYLPHFPKEYRFHFNAHNLIVYGKQQDQYLVSDPIMEHVTTLTPYELQRVRFAKGAFAPNGHLYYPKHKTVVNDQQIKAAIASGIEKSVHDMLHLIVPFVGVKGIRFMGRRIKKWRDRLGTKDAGLYLAQLVRMQEEIGTGGGGFRYIYAAFLQEAFEYHRQDELKEISKMFTDSGDRWRTAAVHAAGIYKGRLGTQEDYNTMGDYLLEIADVEKLAFESLAKLKLRA